MKATFVVGLSLFAVSMASAAEKKVSMKDLPPAVQKAVMEQTKGSEVKGLSKEVVKGQTLYEVETVANGKTRDLQLDASGAVVSVEQEVALDSIPAAARASIEKRAAGKRIQKVERVTKGNAVSYEALIVSGLKKSEVVVDAGGSIL